MSEVGGLAVGIDVGGTKIAGALVAVDGSMAATVTVPTPRGPGGADRGGAATAEVLSALVREAEAIDAVVAAVGIGVPEYVDRAGRITSNLVLDWGIDDATACPTAILDAAAGRTVVFGSDVRYAALAESRLGRGRGVGSFLYVTVGTGISHAFVTNGQVWEGHRGEAIALGELAVCEPLRPDAPATVEAQASGRALEQIAAGFGVAPDDTTDPQLDEARHRAGRIVGAAIVSAISLLDPALVVVGGGLGTADSPFFDELARHVHSAASSRPNPPAVDRAMLGGRAGVVGAGLAGHDHMATAS